MKLRLGTGIVVSLLCAFAAARASTDEPPRALVVHEWGTFTSVAGADGRAVEWLPLAGPSDLPCFVERMPVSPKSFLPATVRMETPVLYFYGPEQTSVDVRVAFPQGLITEWYPHARVTPTTIDNTALPRTTFNGEIDWRHVTVSPGTAPELRVEDRPSHYDAARHTDAAAAIVAGQQEKFLFYRGIGRFQPPLVATITADGVVTVRNDAAEPISDIVLFDSHAGQIAWQVRHDVSGTVSFNALVPADQSPINGDLEQMLVGAGLYPAEAAAMLETWGDSWFEDGTRLFYILPRASVDTILPLTISPAPSAASRVFVGRVELITDATRQTVREALVARDRATLLKYGRFLDAIGKRVIAEASPIEKQSFEEFLGMTYNTWSYPQPNCGVTRSF